ncbi:hypothetical protein AQUCO_02400071v1 [Aquilegia coerulea]|uniref:Ribosomal protein L18 n=1 Tax=Aquilegia coerulea TaxID=218851 RepID=A0A2G5DB44_AQUCA|nr:hypothetical protein AQUCO_02400071v1 [Aquilegia coerulea]
MASSLSFLHQSAVMGWSQHVKMLTPKPKLNNTTHHRKLHIVEAKARTRSDDRQARHARIRKKVEGTTERPRLCVFRSNKHMYVQVIDDSKMHTLASASTQQKVIAEELKYTSGPTIVSFPYKNQGHLNLI